MRLVIFGLSLFGALVLLLLGLTGERGVIGPALGLACIPLLFLVVDRKFGRGSRAAGQIERYFSCLVPFAIVALAFFACSLVYRLTH